MHNNVNAMLCCFSFCEVAVKGYIIFGKNLMTFKKNSSILMNFYLCFQGHIFSEVLSQNTWDTVISDAHKEELMVCFVVT